MDNKTMVLTFTKILELYLQTEFVDLIFIGAAEAV